MSRIFKPVLRIAAPIAGFAVGGPAGAALAGAAAGGAFGGGLKGAALGGLGGAAFGAAPALGSASGLGTVLTKGIRGAGLGLSSTQSLGGALSGGLMGAGGGFLASGGSVPGLGSLGGALGPGGMGPPTPPRGLLGNLASLTGQSAAGAGNPMRLGSLLSAGGDIYGYMQGQSDMDDIQELLERQSAAAQEQFQPYAQAGQTALANMQAPSMEALQNDPGYQFSLQQGQQALERSLAARGLGQSGAALKAAQEYGQGLASQTYDDFFNRQAQMAGMGQSAASGLGSLMSNLGNVQAAAEMERINQRNQLLSSLLGGRGVSGSLSGLGSLLGGYSGRTPIGDFYNGSRINWN